MSPLAGLLALPIRFYRRWVSPGLAPHCRYSPTCSAYALEALRTRGALVGTGLTLRRLGRCHPFRPGGHDPVPARPRRSSLTTPGVPS